jgi:acyl-CoA thioester hydrolase
VTRAPFRHRLRARFNECDPQNAVFNANYLAYFDIAITDLFRALGGYQAIVARSGAEFVVAETGLRFRRPAQFDDELTIETAITRLGRTSMTTSCRILRDGELLVEGTLRHVLVDLKKLAEHEADTTTPIPDWMREGLAPYLERT